MSNVRVMVCPSRTATETVPSDDDDFNTESFIMGHDDDDPSNMLNTEDDTSSSPDSLPDAGSRSETGCVGITC